jgi:hypothetical protein
MNIVTMSARAYVQFIQMIVSETTIDTESTAAPARIFPVSFFGP